MDGENNTNKWQENEVKTKPFKYNKHYLLDNLSFKTFLTNKNPRRKYNKCPEI